MRNLAAVVLAAGKGTRMKSSLPKVLHKVSGRPMLFYPVNLLKELGAERTAVVVGFGSAEVVEAFKGWPVEFVTQGEQLGTGHAVMCAMEALGSFAGEILVLSGDVPLITGVTLEALLGLHRRGGKKAAVSLVAAELAEPKGYGRIIRDGQGRVERIVEEKDCSPIQRKITEVNTGVYIFSSGFLRENLGKIGTGNAQGEYYLPDLVELAYRQGERVEAMSIADPIEVMGVNNRVELARAGSEMRRRILESLMLSGVTIVDPAATYIDYGASVGADAVIYPGVRVSGDSVIGGGAVVEEGSVIVSSRIGPGTVVKSYSIVEGSEIEGSVTIGPFARLRPGNRVAEGARIGNFVEVKNAVIGRGTKANHLSYIGDAVVGEGVNIGAGTITCNYDGAKKHQTTIEDNAFIGSDSQLVAPVKVGKGSYVGSGTTVTRDVPPGALVITRAPEKTVEGWAERRLKVKEKG